MTNWLTVFLYELRQQVSRRAYLLFTFVLPGLVLVAFLAYRAYQDSTAEEDETPSDPVAETLNTGGQPMGYIDRTPEELFPAPASYGSVKCSPTDAETTALTEGTASATLRADLIKRISSPYCLRGQISAYPDFAAGEAALEDGVIDILYVIEPDFVQTGDISAYMSGFNIEAVESEATIEDFILRSALFNVAAETHETLYLRLRDPAFVINHKITAEGTTQADNEDQNFILVYGFGLVMMLGIFWGGGYLMQSVVQEKESRIIEIMLSSVRPVALLLGKILAMGLLSLLQVFIIVAVLVYIASQAGTLSDSIGDIEVEAGQLALMAVYFVLGFLLFGSLMAAIGAITTNMRESQNFVVVVTLPAAIPFFFLALFVEEPDGVLAVTMSMFPLTAPLAMAMRIAISDVSTLHLALSLGLLLTGVIGAIWLAGRMFRVNMLLMGTTPTLRDIPKLLFG